MLVVKGKKMSIGFSTTTDSAFAEILLHSLPDKNNRKEEVFCYHKIMLMARGFCCFSRVALHCIFIIPHTFQCSKYLLLSFLYRVQVATLVLRPSTSIDRAV